MSQAVMLRYEWDLTPWRKLERTVYKLQKRIYRASERGDGKQVHRLQRLLTASKAAKYLAVRRVTQDNRGKKTAGVDGKTALTPKERLALVEQLARNASPRPTRRVWIPKPGKTEKRPLGIPVIADRAHQALIKLSLEPEWEARFEPNSYGFRPGRSCHDAIEAIFGAIKNKTAYVLDADISGCFDNISHEALLQKLNAPPTTRRIIRAWLKAGVMDYEVFSPTEKGTPQGGVISPLLANIALHGMEEEIKATLFEDLKDDFRKTKDRMKWSRESLMSNISIIRYADDFVILHRSLNIIQKAKEQVTTWLHDMGLELNDSKTRISHTLEDIGGQKAGFDFLGFNIRQYAVSKNATKGGQGFKTLIKPSKKVLKTHLEVIKATLKNLRGATQIAVVHRLNPIITGWSRYYCTSVARKMFEKADHETHRKLWRWATFRHSHKGEQWIKRKYFRPHGGFQWRFKTHDGNFLMLHADHTVKRHTKVKGRMSPYDGNWVYWATRMGKNPLLSPRVAMLLKRQRGRCTQCQLYFDMESILEVHHVDHNHKNNKENNLKLVHGHCHDVLHGKGRNVNP
jgi:RNA-directed DNA polymerase